MFVTWTDRALDALADIYTVLPLPEQRALADEVQRLNARLVTDPHFLGESRGSPMRRLWFAESLLVSFELLPGGHVQVLFVSPIARRDDEPE